MIFRRYRDGDFEAMFQLDRLCFDAPFRFSRLAIRRFAEASNALVVIAEEADDLAGFCIAHHELADDTPIAYVVTLDVAVDYRRQGIAAELMRQVEAKACESDCVAALLHVFEGNAAAIRFYEQNGYERMEYAKDFYAPSVAAWVYRKRLALP